MSRSKCIILFLRYPEKGKVKLRLGKELDEETVVTLYRNFVLDILDTLDEGAYSVRIYYTPGRLREQVAQWLGKERAYFPQHGANLGERMKNAFTETFSEGFAYAVLVGSDIPDLPETLIAKALQSDTHDVVIGPSVDGGYYLIGFRKDTFLPVLFHGMPWGTGKVFEKTMAAFQDLDANVHVLPHWRDIDRVDDIRDFFSRHRPSGRPGARTMAFLMQNRQRLKLE
jgi:rSAM/selenodomain-associated transferase 1